jgi:Bacterial PH domain
VREDQSERVYLDSRRHGILLVPPLSRAFLIAASGGILVSLSSPLPLAGAALVLVAAAYALRAVWNWDRTHVILTAEQLALVRGTLRRRTAAVRLERVGAVEVEQSLVGRVFGYGTLAAGPLEITHVPQPRNLYRLVESLNP